MDPDVVEIPPPIHHHPSRFKKQKQDIVHNVIDIDDDDDVVPNDLVIIAEKVSKLDKGKTIEAVHEGYSDHRVVSGLEKFGSVSGIESSNGHSSISHNLINIDGPGSNLSFVDEDYLDMSSDDYADVDDYALLRAQFDNVDIPPGIEAPFTWLPEYDLGLKKTGNSTCNAKGNSKIEGSKMGSSSMQIEMDNVDQSSGTNLSQPAPNKKKSAGSGRRDSNHSSGSGLSKSWGFIKSFHRKMKSAFFVSKKNGSDVNVDTIKVQRDSKTPNSI